MKCCAAAVLLGAGLSACLSAQTPIFRTPVSIASTLVNSQYKESAGGSTGDGLTLYFISRRPIPNFDDNVWVATRKDLVSPWGGVAPVTALNTSWDETSVAVRADDCEVFIAGKATGQLESLYHAARKSPTLAWNLRVSLGTPINTTVQDMHPSVTGDGMELYWQSVRSVGSKIWRVRRSSPGGPFSTLIESPAINGAVGANHCPAVTADGLTILWRSDRFHQSSYNLFGYCIATRTSRSAPFSNIQAVPELGTSYGGFHPGQWSGDGFSFYFGYGSNSDIFRADRILPVCIPTGLPTRGQPFDIACRRDPGDVGVVIGSLWKIPPITIPGVKGTLEINPAGIFWQAVGKIGNMGRFTTRLPIPNVAVLKGMQLHWQAGAQDPASKAHISPLVTTVIQ